MQEAGWTSGDRSGQGKADEGAGSLGAMLLRWARGAAAMHALSASERGSCADDGEGVTIAERVALLEGSDRAVRARARRMVMGAVR